MRRLRFIPEGGAVVEVTTKTLQSRFLLRPGRLVNDIVVGVLGRAQRKYPIRVCAFAFVSNHFHLILDVDDALQLSQFMGYVNSNLARKLGRLVRWREKFWSRRYQAIVISPEAVTQVERLKYVLAHGVKENLVEKVTDWPGVHCARALLTGEAIQGYWFDGTQEHAARRRGEDVEDRMRFAMLEELTLSPLPCWRHLPEDMRRRLIADLIAEIEAEVALRRRNTGSQILGASAVRGQHPFDRPARPKRSPAPLFHAASQAMRLAFYAMYGEFVAAFRTAAEKLRAGNRTVSFPVGSFPPALPFVAG